MRSLRSRIIRLAHSRPDLRGHLLPLLKKAAPGPEAVYERALENLADLANLSVNVQEVIDVFNAHYASVPRTAGIDPQIVSEREILSKADQGLKLSTDTVKALENLVKLYPEDKKYAKTLSDAQKMQERFTKQVAASKKIIRTIAKKIAPKAISALAKKIETAIEARLIDPSQIQTWFSQGEDWRKNVEFYFVVDAEVPSQYQYEEEALKRPITTQLWLKEGISTTQGVEMGVSQGSRAPLNWKPATVDGAVNDFLEIAKGWKNIKGESESQVARSSVANGIASAINSVVRRMGSDSHSAKISPDFRSIEGEYRSYSLPKEGAYTVGENEYNRMVEAETLKFRKALDPLLAPYKDQIRRIEISDGEKSWMSVFVEIK